MTPSVLYRLKASARIKLLQNSRDVSLDRRFGDAQSVGDLLVEQPFAKELKHLVLLRRQRLGQVGRLAAVDLACE